MDGWGGEHWQTRERSGLNGTLRENGHLGALARRLYSLEMIQAWRRKGL